MFIVIIFMGEMCKMFDDKILKITRENKDNWMNCIGTSERGKCSCGSWKNHWTKISEKK